MDGHCEIALVLMPHAVHDVYMKKIKGHIISAHKLYAVTFTESQASQALVALLALMERRWCKVIRQEKPTHCS